MVGAQLLLGGSPAEPYSAVRPVFAEMHTPFSGGRSCRAVRNADVWLQAEEVVSMGGVEGAQAKGRIIANLRCSDAEGGLLGRTLLTLISNKVISHDKIVTVLIAAKVQMVITIVYITMATIIS